MTYFPEGTPQNPYSSESTKDRSDSPPPIDLSVVSPAPQPQGWNFWNWIPGRGLFSKSEQSAEAEEIIEKPTLEEKAVKVIDLTEEVPNLDQQTDEAESGAESKGFFGRLRETAANAAAAAGSAVVWACESPVGQAVAGFAGGAAQAVVPQAEETAQVIEQAKSLAADTVQSPALRATVKNTAAAVGNNSYVQSGIEYLKTTAVNVLDGAVERGYGGLIVRAAKRLVLGGVDVENESEASLAEIAALTGNNDLSTLVRDVVPNLMDLLDEYVKANASDRKQALWNTEKESNRKILEWMLGKGVLNLFNYMDEHPIDEVTHMTAEMNLSKTEELALYLYKFFSPKLDEIERNLSQDIQDGLITLDENGNIPQNTIIEHLTPLCDELFQMALGNTDQLGIKDNLILNFVKKFALSHMAKNFKLIKATQNDHLEGLTPEALAAKLKDQIQNDGVVNQVNLFCKYSAEQIVKRIVKSVDESPQKGVLESRQKGALEHLPAVAAYLGKNKEWTGYLVPLIQAVLLKTISKRIEEAQADGVALTPADTIDLWLGQFIDGFKLVELEVEAAKQKYRSPEYEKRMRKKLRAKGKTKDEAKTLAKNAANEKLQKKLRQIFTPMASNVYAMIGSEIPLPLPLLTKQIFDRKLLQALLPDMLAGYYDLCHVNKGEVQAFRHKIQEISYVNHAEEASRVLAGYITQFVPHLLGEEKSTMSGKILGIAHRFITQIRLDAYIDANKEAVAEVVAAKLKAEAENPDEITVDAVEQYMTAQREEVRKLVVEDLKEKQGDAALDAFSPTISEIGAFLSANQDQIKNLLAENLNAIVGTNTFDGAMDLASPFIEAALLKAFGNIYERVKNLDGMGNGAFLVPLALRIMNTAAEHVEMINAVRIKNSARAAYDVPHEEMIKGFQRAGALHPGVPATQEALAARRILLDNQEIEKFQLKMLSIAKKELKHATETNNDVEKQVAEAKIARLRENLKTTRDVMKQAEALINPIRRENMERLTSEILKFAGITKASDLPLPEGLQEQVWNLIKNDLLPDLGVTLLNKFLDPHTQKKIILALVQIAQEVKEEGPYREVLDPINDPMQAQLDEAVGAMVKQFLGMAPVSLSYAVMQLKGIQNLTASSLGRIIRQKLSKDFTLLGIIESALESGLKNFEPGNWEKLKLEDGEWKKDENGELMFVQGSWSVDENGEKVFTPLDPNDPKAMKFNFPKTVEEKEDADIAKMHEREAVDVEVRSSIAKYSAGQMRKLVHNQVVHKWESILRKLIHWIGDDEIQPVQDAADAAPALAEGNEAAFQGPAAVENDPLNPRIEETHHQLWIRLRALIDLKVGEHFGAFGLQVKNVVVSVCKFVFCTVIGSLLSLICPPIYNGLWWIVEQYIKFRMKALTNVLQMGILEDMWLKLMDDVVSMLNNPQGANIEELEKEAISRVTDWRAQQAILDQMEIDQSLTSTLRKKYNSKVEQAAEFRRLIAETMEKEPTNMKKLAALYQLVKSSMASRPLVGNIEPMAALAHENVFVNEGLNLLAEQWNVQEIIGDGHCLFRAVGTALLQKALKDGLEGKQRLLERTYTEIVHEDMRTAFEAIVNELYAEPPVSVEEIMSNKEKSDLVVQVMRIAACAYNGKNMTDVLREEAIVANYESVADYLAQMSNMNDRKMGGHPELNALAQVFDISFNILQVKANEDMENRVIDINEGEGRYVVDLLLTPSHYNLAHRKPLQVEEGEVAVEPAA